MIIKSASWVSTQEILPDAEAWVGVHIPLFIHDHWVVLLEVWGSHLKEGCQTRSTLIKFWIKHRRQEKKWSPLVPWKDCHSFLHPAPVSLAMTMARSCTIHQGYGRDDTWFLPSWQDNRYSIPWSTLQHIIKRDRARCHCELGVVT